MPPETVDQKARDDIRDVKHSLNNHVHTTDIYRKAMTDKMEDNHKEVSDKVDQLLSGLKWAGGLIVSLLLSVLGWSVLQQINANEAQNEAPKSNNQTKICGGFARIRCRG